MKKWWLNILLGVVIMVIVVPTIIVKSCSVRTERTEPVPEEEDLRIELEQGEKEAVLTMYDHVQKKLIKMPLEQYVVGAVAAEMPASFEMEALKAQAVAARTLAVYKMKAFGGKGCSAHPGADVCSSFEHCQAWISDAQQRKNWGSEYAKNRSRILKAVKETKDEIIVYDGRPIEVFYYSTSNGKTEDAAEVFSVSLPYYGVVESLGEEDAPKYHGVFTFTSSRFIEIFQNKYPSAKLDKNSLPSQISIKSYTESGRVKELVVGGITVKGTDFRQLYGLNSTDFQFKFLNNQVVIYTKGFGHGVGMSQVGADRMAQRGHDYREIIKHYYQGVEIRTYRS